MATNVHQKEVVADACYKSREATRLRTAAMKRPLYIQMWSVFFLVVKRSSHYLNFLWQRGQISLAPENTPIVSETQDLQMKWPFSQVLPPETSLGLPHLSQILVDIRFSLFCISIQSIFFLHRRETAMNEGTLCW